MTLIGSRYMCSLIDVLEIVPGAVGCSGQHSGSSIYPAAVDVEEPAVGFDFQAFDLFAELDRALDEPLIGALPA